VHYGGIEEVAKKVIDTLKKGINNQKRGKLREAARLYRSVLETDPGNADALHLLGLTHYDRKEYDEAQQLIISATSKDPRQPHFHHNMAAVLSIKGELAAAEGYYREAIRLKPDYAEAFYNLSAIIRLRSHDPIIDQILKLLQEKTLSQTDRRFLHFAAGKFLDDIGDYDQAFLQYSEGNAAKTTRYNRKMIEKYLHALKRAFTKDLFNARHPHSLRTDVPVFIVGMPRSGTSLVEQILASHPDIFGSGEIQDINSISLNLKKHNADNMEYPLSMTSIAQDILNGMGKTYINKLENLAPGADRIINKMPLNFWHLGLIACMFSGAKIIHCRRDPLDTCLSCYFQNFTNGQDYAFDLDDLGHFYRLYSEMMDHWSSVLPLTIIEFNYEDLVTRTETVTREILTLLGLEWDEKCAQSHENKRVVETASRWQVRQPVYQSSTKRWKRYDRHLGPLKQALSGK